MEKAQTVLLKLAHNIFKDKEHKKIAIKFLRDYMKEEVKTNDELEDWRKTKLKGQIKRYLSGINRDNDDEITRYFVFTLMKSGTKHLEKCLAEVYGLERFTPVFDFGSVEQSASRIKPVYYNETDFIFGESYLSYHIYPSKEILNDINRFRIRTLVLLRNPAQAIVSHYYYCIKAQIGSKETNKPGEYFGPSIIETKDQLKKFLLEKTFPRACQFTRAWFKIHRHYRNNGSNLVNILFHEDLVKNKAHFYTQLDKIINIQLNTADKDLSVFDSLVNHNQRKGKTDEWKTFFNEKELVYVNKYLQQLVSENRELEELWNI